MEDFTVEELALQQICDLKNVVYQEFGTHQERYNDALVAQCFLKGIQPPPWLIFTADHKGFQRQDSVSSFKDLFGSFLCKKRIRRDSSSVDRPAWHEVPAKKRRLEKNAAVEETVHDGLKKSFVGLKKNFEGFDKILKGFGKHFEGIEEISDGALREETGENQDLRNAHVDISEEKRTENDGKQDVPSVHTDRREEKKTEEEENEGKQDSPNAHIDKWEEKKTEEEENDRKNKEDGVGKGKTRGRGREAKEKKKNDDVAFPVVGRVTRAMAKQCQSQIVLSANKEIGKRKGVASKQPPGARNTRAKRKLGIEVPQEPNNVNIRASPTPVMATSQRVGSSPVRNKLEMRNKSSPVMTESHVENQLDHTGVVLENGGKSSPPIGKEKAMASKQPPPTRTTCAKRNLGIEFPEETNKMSIRALPDLVTPRRRGGSSPVKNELEIKGKSLPVENRLDHTGVVFENKGASSPTIGKRKAMASKQLPITRNTRTRHNLAIEVPQEPDKLTIRTLPSPVMVPSQTGHKSSPVRKELEVKDNSSLPVMTETHVENQLDHTGSLMTAFHVEKQSSELRTGPPIEVKSSPVMTLLQHNSAPKMTYLEVGDYSLRDVADCREEMRKKAEVKLSYLEMVFDGPKDEDYESAQQEETSKMVVECAGGRATPSPDCRRSAGRKDAQQPDALDVIGTLQLQETFNEIENCQISDMAESVQQKAMDEKHMMDFQSQQAILSPLENKRDTSTLQIDSSSVSNSCTPQEVGISPFRSSLPGNAGLVDGNMENTTYLLQEISSNSQRGYSVGKIRISHPCQPSAGTSPLSESDGTAMNSPMRNETEETSIGASLQKNSACPNTRATNENKTETDLHDEEEKHGKEDANANVEFIHSRPSNLVDGDVENTTYLLQEISSSSQRGYSIGKIHFSHPCQPSADTSPLSESDRTVMNSPMRNETEETSTGASLLKISTCPNTTTTNENETETDLHDEEDKHGKEDANANAEFIHSRPESFDSGLRLSSHKHQKSDDNTTLHTTNIMRSRSAGFDGCKNIVGKETTSDSKLLASKKQAHNVMVGRGDHTCNKKMFFSSFQGLHKPLETLPSQCIGGQNFFFSKEESSGPKVERRDCTNENNAILSVPEISCPKGDEGVETPYGQDVFRKTSVCSSSSFNKDLFKQSGKMELKTDPSTTGLHSYGQSLSFQCELGFPLVKTSFIECSPGNAIMPAQSDQVMVKNTPSHSMDESKEGDLILERGSSTFPMNIISKVPSKDEEVMTSQMAEVTEFAASKVDESSVHPLKSGIIKGTGRACDSALRSFCQDEASKGQNEIVCNASRSMVPMKEEEGLKLKHKSWPLYQKQRGQVHEEFHSAGHPRLIRSESCSMAFEYDTSVLAAIPNGAALVSQFDQAVTPFSSNSKGHFDKENGEHRNAGVMKFPSPKDISCQKRGSLEAFPDQQSASLLSSQITKDVQLSPRESKHRQMARLILEEHTKREILSKFMSHSKSSEGSLSSTWLPQVGVDGMRSLVTSNCTSVTYLQEKAHFHATPSKSPSFRSSFELTSPQDRGPQGDSKFIPSDDTFTEFSFQKALGGMEKCDMKSTPLLKRSVVGEWCPGGLSKSLAVNKKPSNQVLSAGQESHDIYTGEVSMNISEPAPRKKSPSMEADCQDEVNFANNEFVKDVGEISGMQNLTESCYSFSSTKPATVDRIGSDSIFQSTRLGSLHDVKMLQEIEFLNRGFSSKDRSFSTGKINKKAEKGFECQAIGDGKVSFMKRDAKATKLYNALGSLTPAPNRMSKCRIRTPSDVRWPLLYMEPQEYSESSREYWGKKNASTDSCADKPQIISGLKDVAVYGSEINNLGSLTPAGEMFFGRHVTISTDTAANLFSNQDQINREHAGCFPIEEECVVEEESMDHHALLNSLSNAKNVLMDCSSAKLNSPITTPAVGRFCESVSKNSTDLLSKQSSMSQKYLNSFNLEEEVISEKENRYPCVPVNKLQKRYDSSVKKKVLRNPNIQAVASFASQPSPRSNQKPRNILSNVKSFIPLVQQQNQAAASIMTGKREIKVKALEAAEAAKRLEEKREQERKMRKELARRGEHEKNFNEKLKEEQYKGDKDGGEENSRATSDCSNKSISSAMARKKLVGCASQKSHVENSSQLDNSACGVDFKLKKVLKTKTKLEQQKFRKMEEEQRRKEEERKKKEADIVEKKRKREAMERKDREEKRKRLEVVQRQQKEHEEQLRAEKEVKEQKRRALDEYERKRKAMEEEAKKQRRIEKEKEAAERRRRMDDEAKAQKDYAGKVSSKQPETEGQPMLWTTENSLQSKIPDINIESYEISPYKGSDEEEDDDVAPGKFIPLWARKENLIPHISSQQYIDPDEIFTGAKTCSLNEVFGTKGSFRRRDFSRRSHSGEWLNDSFTWKEEYQYKLQMGYINKG